jgi:hypothetical protein
LLFSENGIRRRQNSRHSNFVYLLYRGKWNQERENVEILLPPDRLLLRLSQHHPLQQLRTLLTRTQSQEPAFRRILRQLDAEVGSIRAQLGSIQVQLHTAMISLDKVTSIIGEHKFSSDSEEGSPRSAEGLRADEAAGDLGPWFRASFPSGFLLESSSSSKRRIDEEEEALRTALRSRRASGLQTKRIRLDSTLQTAEGYRHHLAQSPCNTFTHVRNNQLNVQEKLHTKREIAV